MENFSINSHLEKTDISKVSTEPLTGNEGYENHPLTQNSVGEQIPQDRVTDWSHFSDPNVPDATDS